MTFNLSGGNWVADTDTDLRLSSGPGSSWIITTKDDTVESYANGAFGQVQSITYRNGYVLTLNYSGTQLSAVSDSYGRTLTFSYYGSKLISVSTPDGLIVTYGPSGVASDLLTSVSYNTTPATSQTYLYEDSSLPYYLTGVVDENGNRFKTWAYDTTTGRATTNCFVDSSCTSTSPGYTYIAYDDSTGNRIVTQPLGEQDTYKFTLLQGVHKVSEIDRAATGGLAAASRKFAYDTNGYISSATNWNDGTHLFNTTTYQNNSLGLPTQIVEASGSGASRETDISYDGTWARLPGTITKPGLTTTLSYDSNGNLQQKVEADTSAGSGSYAPANRTTNYTYTATGQIASVQAPAGGTTAYGYTGGTLTSITDALGHATAITPYRGGGLPQTITDANGVVTTFAYDTRDMLLSSTVTAGGAGRATVYTYDATETPTSIKQPDNAKLTFTLDNAHRVTKITDLLGNTQNFTLDQAGNKTAIAYKNSGGSTKWSHSSIFDGAGNMLTDTAGTSRTTTYVYDPNGNAISITDPKGNPATAIAYDALNRQQTVTDRAGNATQYSYDAFDRPLTVTTPNGALTVYTYDGYGDLGKEISPDRGTTSYHYDGDGNQTSRTDALGKVANSTYDAIDRQLTTSYPADSAENVAYTYDQSGHGFGIGRLTSMTDQAGSFSRSYDERGNITAESRTRGTVTLSHAYAYNAASRLSGIAYPSGMVVTRGFDTMGNVKTLSLKPSSSGASQTLVSTTTHQPFGPLSAATWGSGAIETRTFDASYRTSGVYDAVSGTNFVSLTYAYDNNDNPTTITDAVNSGHNQTLTYDPLDHLATATGVYGSQSFTYDANGNRSNGGGFAFTYNANSNVISKIHNSGVVTNAAGNITHLPALGSLAASSFTYNTAGRLSGAPGISYIYDGFGQRVNKTDSAQRFLEYAPTGELLEVTDNSGNASIDYIYLDGLPFATFMPGGAAGTINFISSDKNGTPFLQTDASHTITWSNVSADPFGNGTVSSTAPNELRFPGQERETFVELTFPFNHNGARNYVPLLGRYLETDPAGLAGGQASTYAYASSNPIRFIDRNGLQSVAPPNPSRQNYNQAVHTEALANASQAEILLTKGFAFAIVGRLFELYESISPLNEISENISFGTALGSRNFGAAANEFPGQVLGKGQSAVNDLTGEIFVQQADEYLSEAAFYEALALYDFSSMQNPSQATLICPR